ncbi:restriction endonuclease subunit S [Anaerofustis sp. NSJ-163]|uniref:restriction endonuclease subunit S n=1 Tax=Anaerofustis sp. NSJ-163 TaxID=2944391 RepID=UPI00209C051C|nr:restriction endonuclease subunit S [Anaerofustis sp. NSJ-163]
MKVKVKLKDITSYSKGQQINKEDVLDNGKYNYLNGGMDFSGKVNLYNVDINTVTVSEGGNSCGYVNYIDYPFWCGAHCYYLYNNNINTKYLYYALKSQQNRLMKLRSGACMPNIKKSVLGDFEFYIDNNKDKQKQIVSILDTVSGIIEKRKKQLEDLDELVKARFVEMFGSVKNNKNGYDIVTIDDVCSLIKDGTHKTPIYTEDTKQGYKFLSSKDVMTQKIDWTNIKYIPSELHEKLYATIQPKRNDILMSKNGVNYGVAAINDTDEVFDIYVSLALLRPKVNLINPIFFRCLINNYDTKIQFDRSIKGIGVPNLHLGEIKKTKIIVPPIELQNQFADFVKQTEEIKEKVKKSLDETQVLFDSLMQKYF